VTDRIVILGSTGSIGRQALEIAEFNKIKVEAICAHKSIDTLEEQIRRYRPKYCAVGDMTAASELKARVFDTNTKIFGGLDGILEMTGIIESETVINSIVGEAGLLPTIKVVERGKTLALANKESLVCAGEIVMKLAKEKGARIIPVDSEHSAIFQCLQNVYANEGLIPISENMRKMVKKLILTASGGPFFGYTREELSKVTLSDALKHPTWSMGSKITIDSATLMNKGLEIIEACHLFGVKPSEIEVVVHRESIIHSMVEFVDNTVIAQMSLPDMRECIQYALSYPERLISPVKPLDLTQVGTLTFRKPDYKTFSLLSLAVWAIKQGGVIPAVMNAANEAAVARFLKGEIGFTDIFEIVDNITRGYKNISCPNLDDIICAANAGRERALSLL